MSACKKTVVIFATCIAVLGLSAPSSADVHVRQVTQMNMVGSPMPTIPEGLDTLDLWLNDHQAAISMGPAFTLLVDANSRAVHMIDHAEQTYFTFDLNFESAMENQMFPLDLEMDSLIKFSVMLYGCALEQANVSMTPTGERKDILGRSTQKYLYSFSLPIAHGESEMWLDETTDAYTETAAALFANLFPGAGDISGLLRKYYPVAGQAFETSGEVSIFGMSFTTYSLVTDYSVGAAPTGVYEIPAGYVEEQSGAGDEEWDNSEEYYDEEYDSEEMDDNGGDD